MKKFSYCEKRKYSLSKVVYTAHAIKSKPNKSKSYWHHVYTDGFEMIFTFSHILYAEQNRILKTVSGLHALKPSLSRTEQLVTIRPSPSINPEFQLLMQNRHFPRSIMASRLLETHQITLTETFYRSQSRSECNTALVKFTAIILWKRIYSRKAPYTYIYIYIYIYV